MGFQSRYRAASHFRSLFSPIFATESISFQSRYRAASHFRACACTYRRAERRCFNLVIERLLISGHGLVSHNQNGVRIVSISLSSGFSFQESIQRAIDSAHSCFNLVIERLLISGPTLSANKEVLRYRVSISLSSGFSFQRLLISVQARARGGIYEGFNLVIERLLISGRGRRSVIDRCFNLVIERLLISG